MPLQGKKVFVIEHSAFISAQITETLKKAGADVKSSLKPCKALLEILHWHPDAIVSNVNIDDEISGFDLCLILKMMPEHAAIPFIIISSAESADIKAKMASVGADYYVPKDSHLAVNTHNAIWQALHTTDDESVAMLNAGRNRCVDHVLVVDDSAVMRRIICNMLANLGIRNVGHAPNGKVALELIDEHEYGMVLTDWNMPCMNGLELTRAIRSRADTRKMPVIMITTEGAAAERQEALEVGVNELISKPFTTEKIRQVLQKFM